MISSSLQIMLALCLSRSVSAFGPSLGSLKHRSLLTRVHNVMLADPAFSSQASTDKEEGFTQRLDPLVVCGPSGVGKGTIIAKYMEHFKGGSVFGFSVSHTTRKPRKGEVDGVHYHFVEMEDMKQEISDGAFLEHAEVHGNLYGTSWSAIRAVQDGGKKCLLDIDVQGVKALKLQQSKVFQPKYIFIAPLSLDTLHDRLVSRGSETQESLERRRSNAVAEMEYGTAKDNFDIIITNDTLNQAVQDFAAAVQKLYDP